jgi:hypothetical protein
MSGFDDDFRNPALGAFPSARATPSSSSSVVSFSSGYRHHHSPFLPALASPQPILTKDLSHHPKTRGSVGIMVVGDSSTLLAGILANRMDLTWRGPQGQPRTANYNGSLTQTMLLHMADANMAAIGGWVR